MKEPRNPGLILGGIYAWMLAVFIGAVLLDIVYSGLLDDVEAFLARPAVYAEVSDFLLMLGALTFLLALAAIALSWRTGSARNLFLASAALLVGFEFLAPAILIPFLRGPAGPALLGLGPYIRLIPAALASLLAFAGLRELSYRRKGIRPA